MSCRTKSFISFLSLLYFSVRTVLLFFAVNWIEGWIYEDLRPATGWCILIVYFGMSLVWLDFYLVDYLHRKGFFSKRFLNLLAVCDVLFYVDFLSIRYAMLLFCILTNTAFWSWDFSFVFGILLSESFKFQLLYTKYLLVEKHLQKNLESAQKLQIVFSCIPAVNWFHFFLRRFLHRKSENRKLSLKKDIIIFACGVIFGISVSCALFFAGMGSSFFGKLSPHMVIMGMFFLPLGAPMIIDLLMLQFSRPEEQAPTR